MDPPSAGPGHASITSAGLLNQVPGIGGAVAVDHQGRPQPWLGAVKIVTTSDKSGTHRLASSLSHEEVHLDRQTDTRLSFLRRA